MKGGGEREKVLPKASREIGRQRGKADKEKNSEVTEQLGAGRFLASLQTVGVNTENE